jgi:uncharacterized protein YciI
MLADHPTVIGGATLANGNMTGSVIIVRATSAEDAKRKLEADIYQRGGAWDLSRAQSWEVKIGVKEGREVFSL